MKLKLKKELGIKKINNKLGTDWNGGERYFARNPVFVNLRGEILLKMVAGEGITQVPFWPALESFFSGHFDFLVFFGCFSDVFFVFYSHFFLPLRFSVMWFLGQYQTLPLALPRKLQPDTRLQPVIFKAQSFKWDRHCTRLSPKTLKKPDTDTTLPLEVSATGNDLPSWPPQTSLPYEIGTEYHNFTWVSMP